MCLTLAAAASAEIGVPGDRATLRWSPASGAVVGYVVVVARNNGTPRGEALVANPEVTLSGAAGEVMKVSVMAYGQTSGAAGYTYSAPSAFSDSIRFAGSIPAPPGGVAILDCTSCRASQFHSLPSTGPTVTLTHPSNGSWELVRFADFAGTGALQGLYRERTTGALWIGDLSSKGLVPRASYVGPGFEAIWPSRTADFDEDGIDEIVMRDFASGRTEIWGLVSGSLTRRATFNTWSKWALIGARDLDGDAISDLWFDDKAGTVWVLLTRGLAFTRAVGIPVALSGYSAFDVADYDGDRLPDVAWRSPAGEMRLSLLRGDPLAPQVEMRALPALVGDGQLLPRLSVDFDGVPGSEIIMHDAITGAVDLILPQSADPALRQRLMLVAPGWRLVQAAR